MNYKRYQIFYNKTEDGVTVSGDFIVEASTDALMLEVISQECINRGIVSSNFTNVHELKIESKHVGKAS